MNQEPFEASADRHDEKSPPKPPEADEPESGKGAGRKGNYQHAPEDQRAKPDPQDTENPVPPKGR